MKGVFKISGAPRYDDLIAERYFPAHLPARSRGTRRRLERLSRNWVGQRSQGLCGGRSGASIDSDPADRTLFYAHISNFIEFDHPVPYRDPDGRFLERMLRELDNPAIAGRALRGRSVRAIDDADFAAIVNRGIIDTLSPEHAVRRELKLRHIDAPAAALLAPPPTSGAWRGYQIRPKRRYGPWAATLYRRSPARRPRKQSGLTGRGPSP